MTLIWVSDLTIIGSHNGLLPGRRQAINRTNAGISLIRPLGTNFSEILIKILIHSFKKMHLTVCEKAAILSRPQCVNRSVVKSPNWLLPCTENLQYWKGAQDTVHFKYYVNGWCLAVVCCGTECFYPYPSGLLHWHTSETSLNNISMGIASIH